MTFTGPATTVRSRSTEFRVNDVKGCRGGVATGLSWFVNTFARYTRDTANPWNRNVYETSRRNSKKHERPSASNLTTIANLSSGYCQISKKTLDDWIVNYSAQLLRFNSYYALLDFCYIVTKYIFDKYYSTLLQSYSTAMVFRISRAPISIRIKHFYYEVVRSKFTK